MVAKTKGAIGPRNFDEEFGQQEAAAFILYGVEHHVVASDSALYSMRALEMQKRAQDMGITPGDEINPMTDIDKVRFGLEAKVDILIAKVPTLEPFRNKLLGESQARLDAIMEVAGIDMGGGEESSGEAPDRQSADVLEGEYSISSAA